MGRFGKKHTNVDVHVALISASFFCNQLCFFRLIVRRFVSTKTLLFCDSGKNQVVEYLIEEEDRCATFTHDVSVMKPTFLQNIAPDKM